MTSICFHKCLGTWLLVTAAVKSTISAVKPGRTEVRPWWVRHSESFFFPSNYWECKQDTLSHHFIQHPCKYLGGSHQLYLMRQHFARVTTTDFDSLQSQKSEWASSVCCETRGSLTLTENPLACLATTQPRANLSLFSLHLPTVNPGLAYLQMHTALPGICLLFRQRGKSCSVSRLISDTGQCIITAQVANTIQRCLIQGTVPVKTVENIVIWLVSEFSFWITLLYEGN